MRVQLVVAAAQPLVRAVQVEGASVEDAVAQLGVWDAAGLRVPAVILPFRAAEIDGTSQRLRGGAAGVAAARLVLAVREPLASAMRSDLRRLRELAPIRVAITDVGGDADPGAELDYLVDYPADMIVFASRLSYSAVLNPEARAVLGEVCEVAHGLGWTTVAEGIRDESQRTELAGIGIDHVSGPITGPDGGPEQLARMLNAQGASLDPRGVAIREPEAPASVGAAQLSWPAATLGAAAAEVEAAEPTTAPPMAPAAVAVAPAPGKVEPASSTAVTGGWASQQTKRRRLPRRRPAAARVDAASVRPRLPAGAGVAAERSGHRRPGARRRSHDTPNPVPYDGAAQVRGLPLLLLLLVLLIVAVALLATGVL